MNRLRQCFVILSLGCVIVLALVLVGGPAVAVPPHRHCLLTPQGWVEVGPRAFDHTHLHDTAFHNFHFNIHVGDVPTTIAGTGGQCSALAVP